MVAVLNRLGHPDHRRAAARWVGERAHQRGLQFRQSAECRRTVDCYASSSSAASRSIHSNTYTNTSAAPCASDSDFSAAGNPGSTCGTNTSR